MKNKNYISETFDPCGESEVLIEEVMYKAGDTVNDND